MPVRLPTVAVFLVAAAVASSAQTPSTQWRPFIADFDFTTGEPVGAPRLVPIPPPSKGTGLFAVAWSPDGRVLLYVSAPAAQAQRVMVLYAPETGQSAELRPLLRSFDRVQWSSDGASLTAIATDLEARTGLFQIDIATGAVARLSEDIPRDERAPEVPKTVSAINGQMPDVLVWAPDRSSFIGRTSVPTASGEPTPAYWWIPVNGKAPRRVDWNLGPATAFAAHGSRVAFSGNR